MCGAETVSCNAPLMSAMMSATGSGSPSDNQVSSTVKKRSTAEQFASVRPRGELRKVRSATNACFGSASCKGSAVSCVCNAWTNGVNSGSASLSEGNDFTARSNENKISDGFRHRNLIEVKAT